MKLAEQIKKYRLENNLTQSELASKLYVTKQAISKWENGKGLPDISLYPDLAKMLGVSIDELMGLTKKRNGKLPLIIALGLILQLFLSLILITTIKPQLQKEKKALIKEIETNLNIRLPKIENYKIIKYNDWLVYDLIYPNEISYVVFKDHMFELDHEWVEKIEDELIKQIPIGSSEYPYICDYYKLVNVETLDVNKIANDKKCCYVLYCLQIQHKRLIAIKFEV